jgi:DNA-binding response OmpR family regulator
MASTGPTPPDGWLKPVVLVRQGTLVDLERCLRHGLGDTAELVFCSRNRNVRLPAASRIDAAVIDVESAGLWTDGSPVYGELEHMLEVAQVPEVIRVLSREHAPALMNTIEHSDAEFVLRPFKPEELVIRVRRALLRARARREQERAEVAVEPNAEALPTTDASTQGSTLPFLGFREAMQRAHDRAARAYLTSLLARVDGEVARAAR